MNLNEDEKRMVYQIENTNQGAALNEIYMTYRYAPNQAMKDTAESLLRKLRPLSDKECMDVIREVQQNYRLPGKARTIGEMLAEARQQSGAQKLAGHDIMALERFDPDTRHMIVFDVLSHESPIRNCWFADTDALCRFKRKVKNPAGVPVNSYGSQTLSIR